MRIIVVLGRVLDPRGIAVNRRVGRVFVNREEYIAEPSDRAALEVALGVKETIGAEVLVLSRGLLPDADVLKLAIAAGADRAVHFVGAEDGRQLDDAASVRVLTAAIERLGGADLLLAGARTLATGQGQLGPRLAEALGWPQVLAVRPHALDVTIVDGGLRAVVAGPQADYLTVEVDLPCVLTIPAGAAKPRYPDGRRLISVYRAEGEVASALEEWTVGGLVDPEALLPISECRGQRFPAERERGLRLRGSSGELAQAAVTALRQRLPG